MSETATPPNGNIFGTPPVEAPAPTAPTSAAMPDLNDIEVQAAQFGEAVAASIEHLFNRICEADEADDQDSPYSGLDPEIIDAPITYHVLGDIKDFPIGQLAEQHLGLCLCFICPPANHPLLAYFPTNQLFAVPASRVKDWKRIIEECRKAAIEECLSSLDDGEDEGEEEDAADKSPAPTAGTP